LNTFAYPMAAKLHRLKSEKKIIIPDKTHPQERGP
jgi:hypothetical protein